MKAKDLTIDQIWTHITDKVMGASAHCEMWAALSNIIGHNLSALHELHKREMLADCGPLLKLSKSAHMVTMTMALCSLYERPDKTECVTLQSYRDKVSECLAIPPDIDRRIATAYPTARKLYKIRSNYFAHGLAVTCTRNIFEEVGLSDNLVINLVAETKDLVVDLANVEGRKSFDLHTDRDVAGRLALTNASLLKAIGLESKTV
ncbi:MAG: hypothetical protein U1F81_05680 [Verrucomicrobiaceae bacterium]